MLKNKIEKNVLVECVWLKDQNSEILRLKIEKQNKLTIRTKFLVPLSCVFLLLVS